MFVSPSENKPGLGKRKLRAFAFDFFLLILLVLPGIPFFIRYLGKLHDAYEPEKIAAIKANDPTLYIILYYWLGLLVVFVCRDLLYHQSPGKKREGLVVLNQQNNLYPSPIKRILRNILQWYTWPLDVLYINNERTLPDTLLGTKIVDQKQGE